MSVNKGALVLLMLAVIIPGFAQRKLVVSSPDEKIRFTLQLFETSLQYKVEYKKKLLIDNSTIQLDLKEGGFQQTLKWEKPVFRDTTENYTLLTGKASNVSHRYKEMIVSLSEKNKPFRKFDMVIRVFNDGVAFRYLFPKQAALENFNLFNEHTYFKFVGDPLLRALLLPGYTSSHEGLYTVSPFSRLREDTLIDMPLLAEYPDNIFVAITEAALLDYAGMYLEKENDRLVSRLSPIPGQIEKVIATLPHRSPWRVIMIGDRIGTLIESNILTTLNDPPKAQDWSWIKPGKSTFPWWNGNILPDTINAPGNNFVTQQYYIDFCARNKLEYHSVVEYGLHAWYTDDGVNFQPGPGADVTKPVPGLNMKEVCDYAHQKGVGIRVWVHWAALYPKLDSAFAIFEKWGISGMMVDFMDRDDQQMVNIQTEMLEKAAKHHLHIQFHGAYKPTGLNRTYPNEFTREGTLNYEVNKWEKKIIPDHDLNIVFTRGLAGSTDYHLGGFRAVPDSLFRVQYTRPLMLGTRCHMLGMYLVLESALQMICDYPAAYEGQPGFSFLQQLPTTWDETRVLDAKTGSYLCIARRKGKDWFIGAINSSEARQINIPLNILKGGSFSAEFYIDAQDAASFPDHINNYSEHVDMNSVLKIDMAAGGGFAVILKKK